MNKISSVYIATSIDGFIARKDGNIDWLNDANLKIPKGEDCGFFAFLDSVDVLINGRKTFDKVLSFGQWPYGATPVIVLSRNIVKIPKELPKTVSYSSESPTELSKRLENQGANKLYIDGGATIRSFLRENLIKDITLTIIPTVLGDGIPLFSNLESDITLKHIKTNIYDFGFIQSTYEIES